MGNLPSSFGLSVTFLDCNYDGVVALLLYRAVLANREDDQIYLNKAEVSMMAANSRSSSEDCSDWPGPLRGYRCFPVCC